MNTVDFDPAILSFRQGKHLSDTVLFKERGSMQEPTEPLCMCVCLLIQYLALLEQNNAGATIVSELLSDHILKTEIDSANQPWEAADLG